MSLLSKTIHSIKTSMIIYLQQLVIAIIKVLGFMRLFNSSLLLLFTCPSLTVIAKLGSSSD